MSTPTQEHDGQADPSEPKTPMWLPALGAFLFLCVGIWWAVTPGAKPVVDGANAAPGASAAEAGAAPAVKPQ